jgi:modulator of FtsH protease HflK
MAEDIHIDTDELKRQLEKLRRKGGLIAGVVLAVLLLSTAWFTVEPEESGVVLRFGAYNRSAPPGLNFKLPLGIERVLKVPIQRQLKEEFGFRTLEAGITTRYAPGSFMDEAQMMTGDLNIADVEWIIQYRIVDPYAFLFKVRNPQATLRDMTEAVMRRVVGDRSVNEVLTVGRLEITQMVEQELQELCVQYENGIKIEQVVLQDVNPPERVKPAFNEVNEAQQEREKLINEARSAYNQVIPRARGEAQQTVQRASGDSLDRVNRAAGEASRFKELYAAYRQAPEVTRKRIHLATMRDVLQQAGRTVVVDDKATGILPLLLFDEKSTDLLKGGAK